MKNDKPIDILNYIKRLYFSPNLYITYRIYRIMLVLIMSQERMNGLTLISIEEKMWNEINNDKI